MPRRVHKFHECKIPSPNSGEDRVKSGSFDSRLWPRWVIQQSATLDRLSRLGDHTARGEPGRRHGRRRLAAEAWPRTI
jgi:hypothetical protein